METIKNFLKKSWWIIVAIVGFIGTVLIIIFKFMSESAKDKIRNIRQRREETENLNEEIDDFLNNHPSKHRL